MSAGPRILFVRFLTPTSPKLRAWVAHSEHVVGPYGRDGVSTGASNGTVVWQLISANNRMLARGAAVLDTFEGARADAAVMIDAWDRLTIESSSEASRGVYGWFAALDGIPVMTCARWYVSDRDRRKSVELALRSLAIAGLRDGARLLDPALTGGELVGLD